MFIDTHCHLDILSKDANPGAILDRATKQNIQMVVNPAVDISSSKAILQLAKQFSQVKPAVGVHPNDIHNQSIEEIIPSLNVLSKDPSIVALGEIGLDYYHQNTAKELQKRVFIEQLLLAQNAKLAVIIHSRESLTDVIQIIQTHYPAQSMAGNVRLRGVFHAFEGNLEDAMEVVKLGFLIGIGGPVTYKNAKDKQRIARELPLESIVLETDSPFLSPVPFRGQINEPANIKIIAEKVANLRECDIKQVETVTTMNADRLFFIGDALVRE